MTQPTLKDKKLSDGQKVSLIIDGDEAMAVIIKRRNKSPALDHGQILVAQSILNAAGVERSKIGRIVLKQITFSWHYLMLNSFDHPDANARLTWRLTFWSVVASSLVSVLLSHYHLWMPPHPK